MFVYSMLDNLTEKALNTPQHSSYHSVTEIVSFLPLWTKRQKAELNLSTSTSEGVTLGEVAFPAYSALIC